MCNFIRRSGSTLAVAMTILLLLGCAGGSPGNAPQPPPAAADTSMGPQVQYRFYTPASEADLLRDSGGSLIVKTGPGFQEELFGKLGLAITGRLQRNGIQYYQVRKQAGVLAALELLKVTRGVLFAEPDLKLSSQGGISLNNPDPRALSEEYSIYLTQARQAWSTYGFGPHRPTVATIDTGINWNHEDFKSAHGSCVSHAFSWYDLSGGNAQLLPTDADPIDYLNTAITDTTCSTASYDDSHGTHIAGTIAAQGNNGKGVAGVCWNTDLISYKALSYSSGSTWTIYNSLYHLITWKQKNYPHTIAVNMSLGGDSASSFALEMVAAGLENNVVIIAAMGNSGQNTSEYPGAYSGVIAVGASNGQDHKAPFSTSGRQISVCAPGLDIISTGGLSTSSYLSMSGTSMAAPFVTGLVSYMLTFNPDLNPAQIKAYLERNADFIDGATGYTEDTGWGRVNVLKTIAAVVADQNANTLPATGYLQAPLDVHVQNSYNGTTIDLTEVPVYLYQLDATGKISNFVACAMTSANDGGDPLLPASGIASFNLLRPGTYVAQTNLIGSQGNSGLIQVPAGSGRITATVRHSNPIYFIHTLADATPGSQSTDSVIVAYGLRSATGFLVPIAMAAAGGPGLLPVMGFPGQPLAINILSGTGAPGGEYALFISKDRYAGTTAPGTFTAPSGGQAFTGSQSQNKWNPQIILPDQIYNGKLPDRSSESDWYRMLVP